LKEHNGNTTTELLKNLQACDVLDIVTVIAAPSTQAADLFGPYLGFVFIDGDHREESAFQDIKTWWPKIRKGGMLAGHDYDQHWPSVVSAVNKFFGRQDVHDPICSHCWSAVKDYEEEV
jgi:hypothetical protein